MANKYYCLRYRYVSNWETLRPALRTEHLALARTNKQLLLAGAYDAIEEGGLLVFYGSRQDVEAFVASDPYVQAPQDKKIVESYDILPWNVAVGSLMASRD